MGVFYLGLNHRTAPVEVRECLALSPPQLVDLLEQMASTPGREASLSEVIVLSTCNRFEIYLVAGDCERATEHVCETLVRCRDVSRSHFSPHLILAREGDAAHHLFAVASGLDSMVLGEPQVLGQVGGGLEMALGVGTAGPVLAALFRKAIECGKRARTETAISEHATSVSHVAVELSKQIFGSLETQRVLLIGAGEMAELAARNLCDNGAKNILVVNRGFERAEKLALEFGGRAYRWEQLRTALRKTDIVICSAGAPHAIIRPDMVRHAMESRRHRPLFLIDIAVPRNVEPDVGRLPSVYVYDIDDLKEVVQQNVEQREREVPKVETIVRRHTEEYLLWLASLDVTPTIRDLRSEASRVCDTEVERALRKLGSLSEREERIVRSLGQGIVNKLLHRPTIRLKQFAEEGNGSEYAHALRELFALNPAEDVEGHD